MITSRLHSLKTTIEVDQFFPRSYFQKRSSLDEDGLERRLADEPSQTWQNLRGFMKKYLYFDNDGQYSWAALTMKELDNYQRYDSVDLQSYYSLRSRAADYGLEDDDSNTAVGHAAAGTSHSGSAQEVVDRFPQNQVGAHVAHSVPKKKSKLKSVFGFVSKKKKPADNGPNGVAGASHTRC